MKRLEAFAGDAFFNGIDPVIGGVAASAKSVVGHHFGALAGGQITAHLAAIGAHLALVLPHFLAGLGALGSRISRAISNEKRPSMALLVSERFELMNETDLAAAGQSWLADKVLSSS